MIKLIAKKKNLEHNNVSLKKKTASSVQYNIHNFSTRLIQLAIII